MIGSVSVTIPDDIKLNDLLKIVNEIRDDLPFDIMTLPESVADRLRMSMIYQSARKRWKFDGERFLGMRLYSEVGMDCHEVKVGYAHDLWICESKHEGAGEDWQQSC